MGKSDVFSKIAVVIATKNRFGLLSERAIPSVTQQSIYPDILVVVDDSDAEARPATAAFIQDFDKSAFGAVYLENQRTEGASGSWNTALDFLATRVSDPDAIFVAFLDDDDAWSPEHLESCLTAAQTRQLDMVAAGIRRIESAEVTPLIERAPEHLRPEDFLVGNPGIQGSNLFLLLSALLAAGGFDEELPSTTDRDLCIRVADLKTVRYGRLPLASVNHYAESDRSRVSTRGSPAKLNGLTRFWEKYCGRMNSAQRAAFVKRATDLFSWRPPCKALLTDGDASHLGLKQLIPSALVDQRMPRIADYWHFTTQPLGVLSSSTVNRVRPQIQSKAPAHDPFALHVGVITSDPPVLAPLLRGLVSLKQNPGIKRLSTVVLDNGSSSVELTEVVERARRDGLEVAVVSESQQLRDAAAGAFGQSYEVRRKGKVGIAQARTMLQRYLGSLLEQDQGAFGWLLDDDMRVDNRAGWYLRWLPAFREQGVDALFGAYEGASPNPPLNGLRVQLMDLFHNLAWLMSLDDESILPNRSAENAIQREKYPDYYYDLSRKHTGHLEFPHWLEPLHQKETVSEARTRLISEAPGILNGYPLTRPIIPNLPSDPLRSAKDSVNRGGCTFVLNPGVLTQVPNTIAPINGREARRSDMIWAVVNRYYRNRSIKAVGFPVHHVGRVSGEPDIKSEKVQEEIIGSALYAGITEFLAARPEHNLSFSGSEVSEVQRLAEQYMERRISMLEQSFHRIAGLRNAIRAVAPLGVLDGLLNNLDRCFNLKEFHRICDAVGSFGGAAVHDFMASLQPAADDFASRSVDVTFINSQFHLAEIFDERS